MLKVANFMLFCHNFFKKHFVNLLSSAEWGVDSSVFQTLAPTHVGQSEGLAVRAPCSSDGKFSKPIVFLQEAEVPGLGVLGSWSGQPHGRRRRLSGRLRSESP